MRQSTVIHLIYCYFRKTSNNIKIRLFFEFLINFNVHKSDTWEVAIFENYNLEFKKIQNEFVSISNHLYEAPFTKTIVGEEKFKKIIMIFFIKYLLAYVLKI